jgi:hypothetical protein
VDKLSSSLWTSYLSYDVCFVSEDMCVDCACMSKWKQWEMDRVDLSMRTNSKEMMINKPPSHLYTDAALPLHNSWVLSEFNYWALVKCSSVTEFIARYQYGVISNGLKQPVTDRFNLCNELYLTSVTKNSFNGRLRRPLPKVHNGNGRCGGQPRVGLPRLSVMGAK